MFKNKLNISVDYYHKVTKDLIDYIPTPNRSAWRILPWAIWATC